MQIDEFLSRLEGVRPNGNGSMACCPAHDDRTPSLSVSEGEDGRILVKCFAGCDPEAIVQAVGLGLEDLFNGDDQDRAPRPATKLPRQSKPDLEPIDPAIVERMHRALSTNDRAYLKAERMLSDDLIDRYQIGREERGGEKRITIPIANKQGDYLDVRRWLPLKARTKDKHKILHWRPGYGTPRLFPIDQLEGDELVLCEGELDALASIDHGIPAITTTCGVGTWPDTLSEQFKGNRVTILMDHDQAGREGAQKRAQSLAGCGVPVKVARWPEDRPGGRDVTDELREHGVGSLRQILEGAEVWTVDVDTTDMEERGNEVDWDEPQPLPDAMPPVEPFDMEMLPSVLRAWIADVAERMQCPPDFPAVGAMVALGAVVGRQVAIRPKRVDDWQVVPNLWGGLVAPPGWLKSPALQEALRPLSLLEGRAKEEYDAAEQEYEAQRLVAEAKQKNAKVEVQKAVKSGSDAYQVARAAQAGSDEGAPVRRRYRTSDTSVEKLGELLNENPRGLLVFRDELIGFLRTLDKDGHETNRAFYLEGWNGDKSFVFDRIGRGTIDIEATCISILGGIQPGPLSAYISSAAHGGAGDDGLVQRFQLMVYPDSPGSWRNVDTEPDRAARQRVYEVFDRLDCIDPHAIDAEVSNAADELPFLRFSPEAQELFTEWRTELEMRLQADDLPPMLGFHLSKYRSLIPSLALLIHLVEVGKGPVGDEALLRACAWGEYLESHAKRVYAPALVPAAAGAKVMAGHIEQGDLGTVFAARDVQQKGWTGLAERGNVRAALELLEDLDWIQEERTATAGRPRIRYRVNPKIQRGGRA